MLPHSSSSSSSSSNASPMRYVSVYASSKAGMDLVDRAHVDAVILEASKGSLHYERDQQKAAEMEASMNKLLKTMNQVTQQLDHGGVAADWIRQGATKVWTKSKQKLDVTRTWAYFDMDMFYAAVELLDRPDLVEKPVAVGDLSMISTANYVARRYGVRSAMPGFIALKLCPPLVFLKSPKPKYGHYGGLIRTIFAEYDPDFESCSLDEASLDLTDYLNSHPSRTGAQVAQEIRDKIFTTTQLTASAGIACNRMLAKVASDLEKPNGQYELPNTVEAVHAFMYKLNIRKLPGVGKITEQTLNTLGIHTGGDLQNPANTPYLMRAFSSDTLHWLLEVGWGSARNVHEKSTEEDTQDAKSMSCQETFPLLTTYASFVERLQALCERMERLFQRKQPRPAGRCVSIRWKTDTYLTNQRSKTVPGWITTGTQLLGVCKELLKEVLEEEVGPCHWDEALRLRLLAVRLSDLKDPPPSSSQTRLLFPSQERGFTCFSCGTWLKEVDPLALPHAKLCMLLDEGPRERKYQKIQSLIQGVHAQDEIPF